MIKRVRLKNAVNEKGEPCFSFEGIFPHTDPTLTRSQIALALEAWRDFLSGQTHFIPDEFLSTLLRLEERIENEAPNTYALLLQYVLSSADVSEEIIKNLFFKLHPSWEQGRYFETLLQIGTLLANMQPQTPLLCTWKVHRNFLFSKQGPQLAAEAYTTSLWSQSPRVLDRLAEITQEIDHFCQNFYEQDLSKIFQKNKSCQYLYLMAHHLLNLMYREFSLAPNFTQDFIFNPDLLTKNTAWGKEHPQAKQLFERVWKDYPLDTTEFREELKTAYKDQLLKQFLPSVSRLPYDETWLQALEKMAQGIYDFYPISYQNTPSTQLPEYEFVSYVLSQAARQSEPTLTLCKNFTQDLRLRTHLPVHTKIVGNILGELKPVWQQNRQTIKKQYLQQLEKTFIPSLQNWCWNARFADYFVSLIEAFKTAYSNTTEQDLYREFLEHITKRLGQKAVEEVGYCDREAFETDLRLYPQKLPANHPLRKVIEAQPEYPVRVWATYVFRFSDRGIIPPSLYEAVQKYRTEIEAKAHTDPLYQTASLALKRYDIFSMTSEDDERSPFPSRRKFWLEILDTYQYQFDIRFIKETLGVIRLKDHLVLEGFKPGQACYFKLDYFKEVPYPLEQEANWIEQRLRGRRSATPLQAVREWTKLSERDRFEHRGYHWPYEAKRKLRLM